MIYPKSKVTVSALTVNTEITEALAWDNGGKPLGVSVSTPVLIAEGAK